MDSAHLLSHRLATARRGLRARSRLCPEQRLLQDDSVLAVDAVARRCGVCTRSVADGLGLYRQAAPALSASRGWPDLPDAVGTSTRIRTGRMTTAEHLPTS